MTQASPTVARWELMLRIRERADERGEKAHTIARAVDVSPQYWSTLVKGRGVLAEDRLARLMTLLEFGSDEQAELRALREVAKERTPFSEYGVLFNDELMRFFGLEAGAQAIRSFENCVIPGLVQTEDYIRALMKSAVANGRPTEVEQRVRARLQRQQHLDGPDGLHLSIVMGQAALMYEVGGPDVHRDQLRQLLILADKHPETLGIQVIPFAAGTALASLNASTFNLLSFESPRLPVIAWLETAIYGEISEDTRRVDALQYLYDQVQAIALSKDDSLRLIDRIASQIG
ncbi:helix-turn-helix domain-containing protein [Nocardia sp. NPDC059240]|uniref:helix-turn-helix domain-containing protein n=1 Tax=Nocardia sp. NPDC059240 TaxID=3346786 RepID=UPI00368D1381